MVWTPVSRRQGSEVPVEFRVDRDTDDDDGSNDEDDSENEAEVREVDLVRVGSGVGVPIVNSGRGIVSVGENSESASEKSDGKDGCNDEFGVHFSHSRGGEPPFVEPRMRARLIKVARTQRFTRVCSGRS